jgi:hypothetical protein
MRCLILLALLTAPAQAHDPSRPELNKWFDSLRSDKGPCCSFTEGAAILADDWESRGGHYRVRLDGRDGGEPVWIDVPDDAVVKQPNWSGRAWVWTYWLNGAIAIRCFMPGTMM